MRKVLVGGTFQYLLSKEGEVMNEQYLDSEVNEYIEIRNDKSDLESKWEMAIGLQQVDNLTPSKYMKDLVKLNIKNEISLDGLENKLKKYYDDLNDSYNRDEHECDFVSLRIMQILQNNMSYLTIDFYKYIHYALFTINIAVSIHDSEKKKNISPKLFFPLFLFLLVPHNMLYTD